MIRRPAPLFLLLVLPLLLAGGGCNGSGVPEHTADEQKAVDELKNQTPQQQIERIQNGPMPEAAKKAMIDKIKKENGIQ